MVLLDDILTPKCFKEPKESVRNWVPSEEQRKHLAQIQENLSLKNIDISLQEATSMIEAKWQQIEHEVKTRVNEMLENLHGKIMEMFRQSSNTIKLYKGFDMHFNPEKLVGIFQVTPLKDLNTALNTFFGMSSDEFFSLSGGNDDKKEPGQENHYIWYMAKLREKFNLQMKQMQNELEEETEKFRKEVGLKSSGLITIPRFESYAESMQYGNQKCDCITFTVSEEVFCKGITVYKNLKPGDYWNMLVMMIQGEKTAGPVVKKQLFRIKNTVENKEVTSELIFDAPVEINAEKKYTVYVLINGPQTFKGVNGKISVKQEKIIVKFFETMYSEKDPKNATGVNNGQIPAIIFSLK